MLQQVLRTNTEINNHCNLPIDKSVDNTEKLQFEFIGNSIKIAKGNCLDYLKLIDSSTVDLILTDPPYNLGNFMHDRNTNLVKMRENQFAYAGWDDLSKEDWIEQMDDFLAESSRVLRKGGALLLFMSLMKVETIINLAIKNNFYYKTTGIWHKTNPMPRNMNLHFVNSVEGWLYFINYDRTGIFNNDGKIVHDFIETSSITKKEKEYGKHPTQKPIQLVSHFINHLSNPDDVVLDPFMGSGTTGVCCQRMNRKFIGIELQQDYYSISKNRILSENNIFNQLQIKYSVARKLKVADLFAGVGGLSQGFISKGFEIEFAVENDQEIAHSYHLNHPNVTLYCQDMTKVNFEELKRKHGYIDIIMGGPPCQGFSQKGQRKNISDERNYLFKCFINAVQVFMPQYFVLENVPTIITTANGFFKNEIITGFERLGYTVNSAILNASNFGIPQNRERAFFIGCLNKTLVDFPEPKKTYVSVKDAIYDLPLIESGKGKDYFQYEKEPISEYQRLLRKDSLGIHNHIATKHTKLTLERLKLIPKGKGKEVLPEEHRTKSIYSGTWSRLLEDGIAMTITTRFDTPSSGRFTHPILNRCLTVREAARLQSFSDKFIFYGSKSSQMEQVGNAVPPLLASEIAQAILTHYQKTTR